MNIRAESQHTLSMLISVCILYVVDNPSLCSPKKGPQIQPGFSRERLEITDTLGNSIQNKRYQNYQYATLHLAYDSLQTSASNWDLIFS